MINDEVNLKRSNFLNGGNELNDYGIRHKDDAELIKKALTKHGFLSAGLNDAIGLWGEYSDSYAAGFLGLPDDLDEIFECIKPYIKKDIYPE